MRPSTFRVTHPTPAERVLAILAAAHSMTVVSDGLGPVEVRRLDGTSAMGHIHLHEPADAGGPAVSAGPGARIPVRLEFTDVAPTPVRDRVRARVTVTGLLSAPYRDDAAESTCVEFGQAVIEDHRGRTFVTLDSLQEAEPDPLAGKEASMLTHLTDDHAELVPLLLRLAQPRPAKGVLRALPLALDRYGMTLRLEYPGTHRDVRLPFPKPVSRLDQAGPQIHALLTAARRSSYPNRLLA